MTWSLTQRDQVQFCTLKSLNLATTVCMKGVVRKLKSIGFSSPPHVRTLRALAVHQHYLAGWTGRVEHDALLEEDTGLFQIDAGLLQVEAHQAAGDLAFHAIFLRNLILVEREVPLKGNIFFRYSRYSSKSKKSKNGCVSKVATFIPSQHHDIHDTFKFCYATLQITSPPLTITYTSACVQPSRLGRKRYKAQ